MRIQTNISALTAYRALNRNDTALTRSLERLSTGSRINKTSDDASGAAISERLRSAISATQQAERNVQDGLNLTGIIDGAFGTMVSITQRMRDLALTAANGVIGGGTVEALQAEFSALQTQLQSLFDSTKYNDQTLFSTGTTTFTLQVGAGGSLGAGTNDRLGIQFGPIASLAGTFGILASASGISLATTGTVVSNIDTVVNSLDAALNYILTERAKVGAISNSLDYKVQQIQVVRENLLSADSSIRDTDVAYETMMLTRSQILVQASTAMLAQANAKSLNLLALLR
ncbi:MAG: flagellin [Candidatus Sericytochromatia bacterium]|nr:flagellin [Candidatus Sericytochromatia bacterium]